MSVVNYINVSLEIWGCVMSLIVAVCLLVSKNLRNACADFYLKMLILNTGALLFDALAFFARGYETQLSWLGVRAFNFLAFSCNYLLMVAFVHYLVAYLGWKTKVSRAPLVVANVLGGLSILLIVLTQFVPIVYYFDAHNVYHRADWFWLSQITGIICLSMCALILARHGRVLSPPEKLALWGYIVLPLLALGVQMFLYGVVFLNLVNTLSLVIVFLFLQAEQGRRIAEQERSLAQSRIAMMLSQIQPHFLYNVLNSIYYLCEKDPAKAKEAINQFSTYLRGNLDSLTRVLPIPFERELEHVRTYLSLEKMRFDEELHIVYDIQTVGFSLPALTVQPLVENAVKCGVGKAPGGGTVTLRTRELADCFEVTVADDGVGYDPLAVQCDGRTHIGIENVRQRLIAMSDARVTITSRVGLGTTAIIRIPKGKQG